ncbi:cell surface A33 antigen-like isoform X2 [Embiotoca jacksoni]|uniref:cell surface A33 antigen-like isoform X2 n=1 Tax=Embiotoca jacksoni TaxID=100190 RepID=UPI0037042F9E
MEKRICVLTLLCLVLSGVGALNVDIPQDRFEFTTGDDITLPCKFTPRIPLKRDGLVIITWSLQTSTADAEETQIIAYYHPSKRSNIRALYEGRVSLDVDIPSGRANLKLNSITLDDNKEFECRLMIPGDDEGKPADITTLVVLEQTKEPSTAATHPSIETEPNRRVAEAVPFVLINEDNRFQPQRPVQQWSVTPALLVGPGSDVAVTCSRTPRRTGPMQSVSAFRSMETWRPSTAETSTSSLESSSSML